jgi:gamma-glutamyl:cysteine ligase YbdK (ATP-grasp superfamily)
VPAGRSGPRLGRAIVAYLRYPGGDMGLEISRVQFGEEDFVRFEARLAESVSTLARVLARPGFGAGPASIGAEVELNLVDEQARPAPINRAVLGEALDPRVTLEVDRFNLEINTQPVALAGRPFTSLAGALDEALAETRRAARQHGARVAAIGILPTLTEADLQHSALTEGNRYRALSAGLRRLRRAPFAVRIEGEDTLDITCDDVTFEGANTSLQVHLRTPPADFARTYNAAQLATAPCLAAACNSPLFLGRRLWDETRVALFRQSVDDRPRTGQDDWRSARVSFGHGWVREGALELFAESVALHEPLLPVLGEEDPVAVERAGGTPALPEMRLHQGTVWRWNRAVYDAAGGGHLRIELRALPAGPTVPDMVANAAFLLGVTLGLAPAVPAMLPGFTFGQARRNFYQAARQGLDAELLWTGTAGQRVRPVTARALVERLLPTARQGLVEAGVVAAEADHWLEIIARRTSLGRTGARWQRRAFEVRRRAGASLPEGCRDVLEQYLARVEEGRPVHEWEEA